MLAITLSLALAAGAPDADLAARQLAEFDAKVLAELSATAPGALEDWRAADTAYRAERWQEAVDGYARVLAAAPGFHHALRRTCTARLALEDRAGALPACRQALAAAETPENQLALARVLASHAGRQRAPPADLAEAARLARRGAAGRADDAISWAMAGEVAIYANDKGLLVDSAARLAALDPGSLAAEYFGVFGALAREEWDEARAHLASARAAGLPADAADSLARVLDDNQPAASRWGRPTAWAALAWVVGLLLLLGAGWLLSGATLRRARAMATDRTGEGASGAAPLRRVYAVVLWLTCAAYYASLPMVLLLILGLGAGLFWAIGAAGRIPVKLVVIVGIVVLVSLWAVVKSLWVSLIRPKSEDPGLALDVAGHPRFSAALAEAAGRVGTRRVDRVFLTPAAEAAVYERGGLLQRLRGRTERCLILGVGLLEGMTQGQLKAVLAHEYGHFVNKDTAGGGLALSVRRAVLTMGRALAEGGAATWYNPAWLFVNGFHRLFLRVSQGASRLQEILADRWAALAYGGANFAAGLRHVIDRDLRFDRQANATLKACVEGGAPLMNLYATAVGQPLDEAEVRQALEAALAAEPSPYDSHPRPADRIAWVGDVPSAHGRGLDDGAPAWSLFADREALERRLTAEVRANVERNHGVSIPAEVAAEDRAEASAAAATGGPARSA